MNLKPCTSVLRHCAAALRLSAPRSVHLRGGAARPSAADPWTTFALSPAPSCSRSYCINTKVRSYLHYLKRKAVAAPTPPYSHVCQVGDPVLRHRAADVDPSAVTGPEVQKVIGTMVRVMRKLDCVGLSAPQVGVPLRIVALEYPESMLAGYSAAFIKGRGISVQPLRIFINPQLRVLDARTVLFQEACESISGFCAGVPRFLSVEVSGLNQRGEAATWQASGWPARILQHEMDHLDGVLYIDRMDSKTFANIHWQEFNE